MQAEAEAERPAPVQRQAYLHDRKTEMKRRAESLVEEPRLTGGIAGVIDPGQLRETELHIAEQVEPNPGRFHLHLLHRGMPQPEAEAGDFEHHAAVASPVAQGHQAVVDRVDTPQRVDTQRVAVDGFDGHGFPVGTAETNRVGVLRRNG